MIHGEVGGGHTHPDGLSKKRSEIRKCSRLKKGLELQKKRKGCLLCGNTLDSVEGMDTNRKFCRTPVTTERQQGVKH